MKSLRVAIFNAQTTSMLEKQINSFLIDNNFSKEDIKIDFYTNPKQKIIMQHQEERYTEMEYIAILSFDVEVQQ